MGVQYSKSRVFAVVLNNGGKVRLEYLSRLTSTSDNSKILDRQTTQTKFDFVTNLNALVQVLVDAGVTTRHFDVEERQWMDTSRQYGIVRAPGPRDGNWGVPDLETFEKDYLAIC